MARSSSGSAARLTVLRQLRRLPSATGRTGSWLAAAGLGVGSALLVVGLASYALEEGVADVARQVALDVTATVFGAVMALYLFQVRVGTVAVRGLLGQVRDRPLAQVATDTHLPPLPADSTAALIGTSLASDVISAGVSSRVLVVAETSSARGTFLANLLRALAEHDTLPVVVDASDAATQRSVVDAVEEQLESLLLSIQADPANAPRLWTRLRSTGGGLVVVTGLDRVAALDSPSRRTERVAAMLDELASTHTPFVAVTSRGLVPDVPSASTVALPGPTRRELADYLATVFEPFASQADGLGAQAVAAATRSRPDPYVLHLTRRLLLDDRTDRAALLRRLAQSAGSLGFESTVLRRTLEVRCGPSARYALIALGLLGRASLMSGREVVSWPEATRSLDGDAHVQATLGLAELERADAAEAALEDGHYVVRFRHPLWLSYAMGTDGLDGRRVWGVALLRSEADAVTRGFSFAALAAGPRQAHREVDTALTKAGLDLSSTSLKVLTALHEGLLPRASAERLDAFAVRCLRATWDTADDAEKLGFLGVVDVTRSPMLLRAFWDEVGARLPGTRHYRNSRRVRRAMCIGLGEGGATAWATLGPVWRDLVERGLRGDLSAQGGRGPHWLEFGGPLSHLAWILPILAEHTPGHAGDEVEDLLSRLWGGLLPPFAACPDPVGRPPDIGLEISLAEGFKFLSADGGRAVGARTGQRLAWLRRGYRESRSWYSKVTLVHALALTLRERAGDPAGLARELDALDSEPRHPIVRSVTESLVAASGRGWGEVTLNLWSDEADALASSGEGLSATAHRLLTSTALVANLAEEVIADVDDTGYADAERRRDRAFLADDLPHCVTGAADPLTLGDGPCACPFALCGRPSAGISGPRRFSPAFLRRSASLALGD